MFIAIYCLIGIIVAALVRFKLNEKVSLFEYVSVMLFWPFVVFLVVVFVFVEVVDKLDRIKF